MAFVQSDSINSVVQGNQQFTGLSRCRYRRVDALHVSCTLALMVGLASPLSR